MINEIKECFKTGAYFYSGHAKSEMEMEELGEIREQEVFEAALSGKIIEHYPNDEPYPSCLICGSTSLERPLHIVCAFSRDEGLTIVVTVYEPSPDKWIDFSRRKK